MSREIRIRGAEDLTAAVGEVRRNRHLTQQELADEVGITRSYLAQVEVGRPSSVIDHALTSLRRMGATVTVTYQPLDSTPAAGAKNDEPEQGNGDGNS